jgi:predicted NBD/HSP70 family sugar kinase
MSALKVEVRHRPVLDPGFLPAVLWDRAYSARVAADPRSSPVALCVRRRDGTVFREDTAVLPHLDANVSLNLTHVERMVKALLWMKGGSEILVAGHPELAGSLSAIYSTSGSRAFDCDVVGRRIYGEALAVRSIAVDETPAPRAAAMQLGRNLDGCRIGFDLGGSDRKCAAVIGGEVVHAEEVEWSPYFESDPGYHFAGIMDSLARAAAHLPRVDAIGGSAAGVYVDNEPRVASLFRGISDADFEAHIRPLFRRLRQAWNGVPFEVVNDGEVTALAASMSLGAGRLLGISMGTSLASGYCDADGRITSRLNELAFAPVDYRGDAPVDEWSGDIGCGVQYFSQQAVARLARAAGIDLPEDLPFADRLKEVQALMAAGDQRAAAVYRTIGVYLGYSIAWYARWYDISHLLVLGRVTSGSGGAVMIEAARAVLADEFPELASGIAISTPDEQFKRHGQAIAAASLPRIPPKEATR